MGSDPFMTEVEAKTPTILTSIRVSRGPDPIKSTEKKISNIVPSGTTGLFLELSAAAPWSLAGC